MSKKDFSIKLPPKKIPRNTSALSAKMRSGGGFHKNKAEKGGNTNKQKEYLSELDDFGPQEYAPGYTPEELTEEDIKEREQAIEDAQKDYVKVKNEKECTCDNPDKGVARGCPIHDPNNRWEDC